MGNRSKRRRILLFTGVGVVATAIGLAAYAVGVLSSLEQTTIDTRYALRSSTPKPTDVVVVGVDAETFDAFNNHSPRIPDQWPFPRRYHARVINTIAAAHPREIAMDIQFTEAEAKPDAQSANNPAVDDNALVQSVINAKHVVLSTTEVGPHGTTNIFGGYITKIPGAYAANESQAPDSDGVIRRVPNAIDGLTTFGIAAAAAAERKPIPKPTPGLHWIDFAGHGGKVPTYSYSSVYLGKVPPSAFRNKIVVIGATAPVLQDVHPSAVSGGTPESGPEIQANEIESALRGFPLRSAPTWLNILFIAILGMLPALSIRLSAVYALVIALVAAALFLGVAQLLFDQGYIIFVTYPLLALAISTVGSLVVFYVLEAFERALTRDVFARFVPEAVVDQVLKRTGGELRLGGETVFGTAMFTDLRGFTTFSEGKEAEEVIGVLNRYLASMSDAVLAHGGTLVTYTGDGLMAVFGAPLPQKDHADRALDAAREMLEVRLPAFNEWLIEEGHEYQFKMGVGLMSGEFMSGNVGSERRLEYTAIGDTINTCSRIEGLTKGTPYALFMAGSTKDTLTHPPEDLVYIEEMAIRGRENAISIWSLTSELMQKKDWESEVAKPAAAH